MSDWHDLDSFLAVQCDTTARHRDRLFFLNKLQFKKLAVSRCNAVTMSHFFAAFTVTLIFGPCQSEIFTVCYYGSYLLVFFNI